METLESRLQKRIHVSLYALLFLVTLLGLSVLLEGCTDKCEVTNEYTYYEPVYTTVAEIRESVAVVSPQPLQAVGKIYFKDGIVFINDPGKGIHIIHNHNPAEPRFISFLRIPGNFDLAIKGNTLYADSYVDLVAFDVSDITKINEVSRIEGLLKNYQVFGIQMDANCCLITSWEPKKNVYITESECNAPTTKNSPNGGVFFEDGIALLANMSAYSAKAAFTPGTGSGSGVGGSLAKFTINGDYLYLLDGSDLQAVSVRDERNPVEKNRTPLAWDIETIFPYKNNLFIGSSSGMHIMDLSHPESPVKLSTYEHIRSCDPVVVDDDYAYVTLRSGTTCEGFTNQLEIIDIKDLSSPQLVKTYPMTNPNGLGIDNKTLFICDGDDGLKTFDVSDILKIDENQIAHFKNIHALDVIPFNNVLMMIGEDGIFQFDYSNPKEMKLLSKIEISHEQE